MSSGSNKKTIRIIAVPIDLGASRRGTDAGPSAMRVARLHRALAELGHDVDDEVDIPVPTIEARRPAGSDGNFKAEILAVCTSLANETRKALEDGCVPLIIGGDHSLAMGSVSGISAYYRERGEELGLIWIDAHADMNVPGISPTGNIHGMPLAHLLGYGDEDMNNILGCRPAVRIENAVLIGIRDVDAREREFVRETGVKVFTMRDIDEMSMSEVCRQAIDIVTDGTAGFHISFDVDGCDPSVMPGSGTLVPGGINYRETHLLLEACADTARMTSMDVVELNPFLDDRNISAERAVKLVQSAFGRSIL